MQIYCDRKKKKKKKRFYIKAGHRLIALEHQHGAK